MTHTSLETSRGLDALERRVRGIWQELLGSSRFVRTIQQGEITRALYALYLLETYHYTRHNARNQALVGVRCPEDERQYQRFCFEHAAEEVGHEQMALHDVISLGFKDVSFTIPEPLPATVTLTGYLYWISYQGNPLQRLGYSYWAESCYEYVRPLMGKVRETLGLAASQMTFFVAHAEIDAEHSRLVNEMLSRRCKTAEDWHAVGEVMETSLRLTGRMMDEVVEEYARLCSGSTERCAFLRSL
jgi:pyrroloquinoline quinone (PQQ) biosynthesis protein C